MRVGPDQHPGPRRARAADRPGPLPGRAGHAARGDAGQRAGRDGLQPRGRGRRQPRPGGGQRPLPRRWPASTPTRRGRGRGRACRSRPGEAEALARRGRVPPPPHGRCRPSRSARLAETLPLPAAVACPTCSTPTSARRRSTSWRPTLLDGIGELDDLTRRARRDRPTTPHRRAATSSSREQEVDRLHRLGRRRQDHDRGGASRSRRRALGRKACVVTIDPAKRLADALGLEALSNTPSRIDGPWPGELWALMLDTKSTFDDLVRKQRRADPEQAERILANRFYRNISGALSGTQEYMAMEKLYELHDEHRLRPRRGRHAADPQRPRLPRGPAAADPLPRPPPLPGADGADPGRRPGGQRGRPGVPAHGVEGRRRRRRARRHRLLPGLRRHGGGLPRPGRVDARRCCPTTSPPSCWWPRPRGDVVEEATYFAARLHEADIPVRALVVNRMHPRFADGVARRAAARGPTACAGTDLGGLYANLADFAQVAADEEEHLAGPGRAGRAGAGRAGAVPAHRRARPRRAGRDRPPPVPALTRDVAWRVSSRRARSGGSSSACAGVGRPSRSPARCDRSRWCAAGGSGSGGCTPPTRRRRPRGRGGCRR